VLMVYVEQLAVIIGLDPRSKEIGVECVEGTTPLVKPSRIHSTMLQPGCNHSKWGHRC